MSSRPLGILCMVLSLVLSGCTAPQEGDEGADGAENDGAQGNGGSLGDTEGGGPESNTTATVSSVVAIPSCPTNCFETNIAVAPDGTIYVTSQDTDLATSRDGGRTFVPLAAPPLPPGASPQANRGDEYVQTAAGGTLYYSAPLSGVGIQVAASDDGGETWPVNTLASTPLGGSSAAFSDRQWLALGSGKTVFLSFQRPLAGGFHSELVVGRSDDGGATFGPLRSVTLAEHVGGIIGGPGLVAPDGALHIAFFAFPRSGSGPGGGPPELRVATSVDGGEAFRVSKVYGDEETYPGEWFPVLALATDGSLHLAWNDLRGSVLVSTSGDGGATWTDPVKRSLESEMPIQSPWIVVDSNGVAHVLYYVEGGDSTARLVLTRAKGSSGGDPGAIERTSLATNIHGAAGRLSNTDMAHMAQTPDGRLAIVWSDSTAREAHVAIV